MSGKLGGTVFARNKGGAYARNWVNPINPNTTRQQNVRTAFANLVQSWKNLSAADQQAWEDMAPQYPYINRVGEASEYSGQQLYLHLNMNLQVVGSTTLSSPLVPQNFTETQLNGIQMELALGVLDTATVALTANGTADEAVIIEMTTSVGGGITKPAKGLFKQVQIETSAAAATNINVLASYQALYGDPEEGANVWCRCWMINKNTGQRLNLGQAVGVVTQP